MNILVSIVIVALLYVIADNTHETVKELRKLNEAIKSRRAQETEPLE